MNDPAGHPVLDVLDADECLRLISPGGVGRVGFGTGEGPVVLPVNFTLYRGAVLFRTSLGSPMDEDLRTGVEGADFTVAFEVDWIDQVAREGWSVLIQGPAHHMTSEEEQAALRASADSRVEPWAGGERHLYVRVTPARITGRRIRHER